MTFKAFAAVAAAAMICTSWISEWTIAVRNDRGGRQRHPTVHQFGCRVAILVMKPADRQQQREQRSGSQASQRGL